MVKCFEKYESVRELRKMESQQVIRNVNEESNIGLEVGMDKHKPSLIMTNQPINLTFSKLSYHVQSGPLSKSNSNFYLVITYRYFICLSLKKKFKVYYKISRLYR